MTEFNFENEQSIIDAYKNGFVGAMCDPEDLRQFLARSQMPVFGVAAYELKYSGEGKLSLPFKSLLKFVPDFGYSESQTTGDCVSHATRNAVDITRAVEIDIKGEAEAFEFRGATEGIYQSRGHYGQGMSCSRAASYVSEIGGLLIRKKYDGIDLSKYNSSIGANHKIPDEIYETEAQKNPVSTVSLVSTVEEARDALANGYGLSCCSDLGFSETRDEHGIARRSGSWSHAMAWIACDDTREIYDETLFLVQNSWGKWNDGPKRLDQPEGSFWIREKDARAILNSDGSFAFSNVVGFPARQLPNYGLGDWL